MKKVRLLTIGCFSLLVGACSGPVSDKVVKTMVAHCESKGMATRVFNGLVSWVDCIPIQVTSN